MMNCCSCFSGEQRMAKRMKELEDRASVRRNALPPLQQIRVLRWEALAKRHSSARLSGSHSPHHEVSIKSAAMRLIASMRLSHGGRLEHDFSVEKARRMLLNDRIREELSRHLPNYLSNREWTKIFSTEEDGTLTSLYQKCQKVRGPVVIVIMDSHRHVFGAFVPTTLELQPRLTYFGNGETFLFRAHPTLEVYPWTRSNSHFVMAARDSIGVGGGGMFGLWLDADLEHGTSHTSSTFNNKPLASEEDFDIVAAEIYAFHVEKRIW